MARTEADREDLYAELTSCVARWELLCEKFDELVLIGVRKDGRLSIFFGPDPVYHFTPQHQLNRAYVDGLLFRTQGHTLAQLKRVRSESETTLLRHDLDAGELAVFLKKMRESLRLLLQVLTTEGYTILRQQYPEEIPLENCQHRVEHCLHNDAPLAEAYKTRR